MAEKKVKIQGLWASVTKAFRKANGAWSEIDDNTFNDTVIGSALVYGGHQGPSYSEDIFDPSAEHEPNQDIIYTNMDGKPNVVTNASGQVVEYRFTDEATVTQGVDTGIIAFDGNDFEIYLKATLDPSDLRSASAAPIINARKDSGGSYLYGITVSCTHTSSAQIMSSGSTSGLRMNAVTYSGSQSVSKWMRMAEMIGSYYYYFGVRDSDGPTTYVYRITKSGSTVTVHIYDESDTSLIGVPMTSSTSGEYTFDFDGEFDDITIEIGHSTSRQGADQYCELTVLEFEARKI